MLWPCAHSIFWELCHGNLCVKVIAVRLVAEMASDLNVMSPMASDEAGREIEIASQSDLTLMVCLLNGQLETEIVSQSDLTPMVCLLNGQLESVIASQGDLTLMVCLLNGQLVSETDDQGDFEPGACLLNEELEKVVFLFEQEMHDGRSGEMNVARGGVMSLGDQSLEIVVWQSAICVAISGWLGSLLDQ